MNKLKNNSSSLINKNTIVEYINKFQNLSF